jgi:DNA relaxase NicK
MGGVITRVDFALDDRAGRLSMDVIGEHIDQELLTSRWRKGRKILATLAGQGRTFEFGSRRSDSFLRIYDKQAEQLDKGKDDPGEWVRVELELKREKADEAARRYVQEGEAFVVGLLRGLIEFKERGEDQTKARWAACDWWVAFLEDAEKARLSLPKVQPTIERNMAWMELQWSRTLARVVIAEGGCFDRVHALMDKGSHQLKASDQVLIEEYQTRVAA